MQTTFFDFEVGLGISVLIWCLPTVRCLWVFLCQLLICAVLVFSCCFGVFSCCFDVFLLLWVFMLFALSYLLGFIVW